MIDACSAIINLGLRTPLSRTNHPVRRHCTPSRIQARDHQPRTRPISCLPESQRRRHPTDLAAPAGQCAVLALAVGGPAPAQTARCHDAYRESEYRAARKCMPASRSTRHTLIRQAAWRNWSSGCASSPSCARHSALGRLPPRRYDSARGGRASRRPRAGGGSRRAPQGLRRGRQADHDARPRHDEDVPRPPACAEPERTCREHRFGTGSGLRFQNEFIEQSVT
jgi:hypothetical protein